MATAKVTDADDGDWKLDFGRSEKEPTWRSL